MRFAIRGLALAATICLVPWTAWTQAGQVRGEIRVNDGQGVPEGIEVNLDRQDGGFDNHYGLETDDRGNFLHLSVEPGDYEITFEYDGGFYLTITRVSTGDFEIQLELDRLEYAA